MKKPESDYDVVVIGAGIGGLTAAAILSKAGLSVCVLEKEPHVGGYLAGFRRKGFIFDTAIHWLNQCGPNGVVTRLFDMLGMDHPRPVTLQRTRRYLGNSYNYLLTNHPDDLKDQLISLFPGERKGIERFFFRARKIGHSLNSLSHIFRSEETMSVWEKLRNKLKVLKVILPFMPYISYSGDKGLKRGLKCFFKDEQLHNIFASETEMIGCMVPIGWSYADDFQCPPKGGARVIPLWLKYVVEYYGSVICTRCSVKEVIVQNNTATGVLVEHKGQLQQVNSKYVIAACDIETLYEKMLPREAVPEKLKRKLRQAELYSSSVTIFIGLDCTAEELGFGEEMIHIADERQPYGSHHTGDPATTEISILAPSVRDKSVTPEQCGSLVFFMPALMDSNDYWGTVKDSHGEYTRGAAYKALKQRTAEVIIARVEALAAPGLRSHILFYEVATPITHYRYTGNKNGTMMGAKPGRKNMQNKIAHYQTPVKHLLLGGHWAELGGGVPVAAKAGTNAGLMILKKENRPAFNALCRYIEGKLTLQDLLARNCFKSYDHSWVQPLTPAQSRAAEPVPGSYPDLPGMTGAQDDDV
ncbi:MAG: NAD(P)/FAD-dependent oxidoreductase [Chitinophagaceae bacterium]|nr:NAD(P)/FAD-dependent oxidoreductase [Chitinophagaceae bacterium]